MQILTLVEAKAAARDAYCARRLTAQHPHIKGRQCKYEHRAREGLFHCAIGAGLSPETISRLYELDMNIGKNIRALATEQLVRSDDLTGLRELQILHDAWCSSYAPSSSEKAEQIFLKFIYS